MSKVTLGSSCNYMASIQSERLVFGLQIACAKRITPIFTIKIEPTLTTSKKTTELIDEIMIQR